MALVQDRFKDFEISVNHVYLLSRPDKGSQVRRLPLQGPQKICLSDGRDVMTDVQKARLETYRA